MKKILLTAVNARYSHSNPAVLYLRQAVRDLPFTVITKQFSINTPAEQILEGMTDDDYAAAGISVYIWNASAVRKILPLFHEKMADCSVFLGGPEVSFSAQKWLNEFPWIRWIITGPGEGSFRYLLQNDLMLPERIISLKAPAFSEINFPYIKKDFITLKNRFIYYESSRGCPYRCSYCLSSRTDPHVEFRDIEDVKKELVFLFEQKPEYVKFIDRTFNCSRKRSREIWKFIIDNFSGGKTCFHFEIMPGLLEDEDLELLSSAPAGLIQLEAGIQSVHRKTLEAVNRPFDRPESRTMLKRIAAETKVHLHVDMITGLPFEDMTAAEESFNEIWAVGAQNFQVGFLKVLPGTEIACRKEFGIICEEDPPYMILENRWLSRDEISSLHGIEAMTDCIYNSGGFRTSLAMLESLMKPFSLMKSLAEFQKHSGLKAATAWPVTGEFILAYIRQNRPELVPVLKDCLRWDWFSSGRGHRLPKFLIDEFTVSGRKRILKAYNKKAPASGDKAEQSDLKHTGIFFPETDLFRSRFMEDCQVCLFPDSGGQIPVRNLFPDLQ